MKGKITVLDWEPNKKKKRKKTNFLGWRKGL